MTKEYWMQKALEQANIAYQNDEVPIGAVVVHDNKIIGSGYNSPIKNNDPTAHAEILALRNACKYILNYRLIKCDIYITLEPCMMCLGAIIQSRISNLIFGACSPKSGVIASNANLHNKDFLNHKLQITSGILASKCEIILKKFFAKRRSINVK